ncbi:carbonic anhydrase [Sphingomonas sp. OK281]|nr:carbonic anhydrase [Sphingomonas sp. OK281]
MPTHFPEMIEGYHRFKDGPWEEQRERWKELQDGQSPKVMIIACSDSRVEPAQIFDTLPGEVFVVRNVANLVPPFETGGGHHGVSAAIEFAVTQLKVEEIVVMGHEKCGGCKAALTQAFADAERGAGGFVSDWVSLLDGAREKVVAKYGDSEQAGREMELESVRTSIANLRTFPFVTEAEAAGKLALRGAYFGIDKGQMLLLNEDDEFIQAEAAEAKSAKA